MLTLAMTSSTTPVLRGGRANFVLPILVIALLVLWNILQIEAPGRYILGAFVVFWMIVGLHMYGTTVVRMTFRDDDIEVMFPLHVTRIRYDAIGSLKMTRYSLTPLVRLRIRGAHGARSLRVTITGPYTPWGSLDECIQRLREEFYTHGVMTVS